MTLPASWETLCRSRTGQLERDMEQCTGWKIGKGLCQGYIYCHPACLTYAEYTIRNAALDESKSGLRIVRRSINNLRYADDTTLMTESEKELKSFLIKVNESKKAGLKLNIQKTKITASSPNTSKHRWRKNGNSDRFYFLGLQRKSQTLTAAMNQKKLTLWKKSYDEHRQRIKKQRHHFANKGPYSQSYGFSGSLVWMWELDQKEGWALKNWCFRIVVLKKTLERPLDSMESKAVNPKGNQPWIVIGRIEAEAEAPILCPADVNSQLIGKDPDAGKD